ncbi:MAG TPA: hypothetical protein VGA37_02560 [Gemmatimonadales bacterium]
MRVTAVAPVRIDLAGGWSDVPAFASREGGVVTNVTLDLCARVECRPGGKTIRLHAADLAQRVVAASPSDLVYDGRLDLHKAALNMLPVTGGIEIWSRSDVPPGSGLGASGALDVALVAALAACRQETFDPAEIAELAFRLEAVELQLDGGRQDQYAAALGGWHRFDFAESGVTVGEVPATAEQVREFAGMLVVAYTGETHFSADTHRQVWAAYRAGRSETVEALRVIRDCGAAAAGALARADWRHLAAVVDENWRAQQRLDASIATPTLRRVEEAMRVAGAWGIKATGAGAGGCLVALGEPGRRDAIGRAAESAGATVFACALSQRGVEVRRAEDDGA